MDLKDTNLYEAKTNEMVIDITNNYENSTKKKETFQNTQLVCVKILDYMMF